MVAPPPPSVPDDLDLRLIERLREDGRRPNNALAADLGISEATVAARIRSLRERKLMLVTLQRDLRSEGYDVQCLADVYVVRRSVDAVARELAAIDAITSVSLLLGSPEILVVFKARDHADMLEILDGEIARVDGVKRVETSIALAIRKLEPGYADLSHLR